MGHVGDSQNMGDTQMWEPLLCFFWGVILVQVFVNARLHVSGGALGGGRMVEDASSVAGL
jgi:hypothetical protein